MRGLDKIQNVLLLAIEIPGFPQDILDCYAAELTEKELERLTVLGEPEDGTVMERPELTACALREGFEWQMT
jgi:hypothetical protein